MDPFERCWNVCVKPARGRVHPVAVVTASSRMSRNSRARWPPVLQPTGAPCEGCPMCIHPDDRPRRTAARCQCVARVLLFFSADHRDEWTLDNPHTARPLAGARVRVAIRRASFATSDCWQSPQLPGGLGHAPVSRQLHRGGLSTIAKQVISARSGDRDDREVRDGKNIWKVPPRWSALYSASHWHSSWEPRLVLRAKESNNQKVWRGIKQSKSHKYHYPIPLVFRIKLIKIPGNSREMGNTGSNPV